MSDNQNWFQKHFRDEEIKRKAGWFRGKRTWWEIAGLAILSTLIRIRWVLFYLSLVAIIFFTVRYCNRNAKVTVPGYEERAPKKVYFKSLEDYNKYHDTLKGGDTSVFTRWKDSTHVEAIWLGELGKETIDFNPTDTPIVHGTGPEGQLGKEITGNDTLLSDGYQGSAQQYKDLLKVISDEQSRWLDSIVTAQKSKK